MQKRYVQWVGLAVVVILATALRVYQLKDVPAGLFCDEAGLGYNSYTIATAGTDENGNRFPIFFWSFGVTGTRSGPKYSAPSESDQAGVAETP